MAAHPPRAAAVVVLERFPVLVGRVTLQILMVSPELLVLAVLVVPVVRRTVVPVVVPV